jgi:hypothetical protein
VQCGCWIFRTITGGEGGMEFDFVQVNMEQGYIKVSPIPFNSSFEVSYTLTSDCVASINVTNLLGKNL